MKVFYATLVVILSTIATAYFSPLSFQTISLSSPFEEAGGNFGRAVDGIGDVNNDGYSDVLIGADLEDVAGLSAAGRAYVFSGLTGDTLVAHTSPNPQVNGRFGGSVTDLGDVSSDGIPDYAVSAWNEDDSGVTRVGKVYVYSGATHSVLYIARSPVLDSNGSFGVKIAKVGDLSGDGVNDLAIGAMAQADMGLSSAGKAYVVDGVNGVVIRTLQSPNPEVNGTFGSWIADVGDIDSDGRNDVGVGAFFEEADGSPFAAGRAYVFDGASGDLVYTLESSTEVSDGLFGGYIAGGGDFNNDGVPDFLVGARNENGGEPGSGRVHAFSGASGDTLFTLVSPVPTMDGLFGSVAVIGDYDNDGYDDFAVGAAGENEGEGLGYIFSGQSQDTLASFRSPSGEENGFMGARLELAGDVNNDGTADLIVSATREDPGTSPVDAGRAHVFLLGTETTVGTDGPYREQTISATNYPNPFGDATTIQFSISQASTVVIDILDVTGRTIHHFSAGTFSVGSHTVDWDGRDGNGREVGAGVYFYIGEVDGDVGFTGQMIRIR